MGHKLVRKGYRLRFADGSALDGATIVMGSMSVGRMVHLMRLRDAHGAEETAEETANNLEETIEALADGLISWDLEEEDGTPIPPTVRGISSFDVEIMFQLLNAWIQAVSQASPPLPGPSGSGATPPGLNLPMEPLSPSPAA